MSHDSPNPDHDPITPLTEAEKKFIHDTVSGMTRDEVMTRLRRDLQTAVQIELATIPIYLYTYYSLVRNRVTGENIQASDLFANKAGSHIMSVAVEEMLHLSLASNIYFSLFGAPPLIYTKSPYSYPTPLPHHAPGSKKGPEGDKDEPVLIPLAPLGFEQLWHFLQIEYPEGQNVEPKDDEWETIGQFYSYIRCLFHSKTLSDSDFQNGSAAYQIQPYNYSPNNVDTLHPRKRFNPWNTAQDPDSAAGVAEYSDEPGSHVGPTPLITVSSIKDALEAIDTICDQGEGANVSKWDDPQGTELSHYYKFLLLQAQFEEYGSPENQEQLPDEPPPPDPVLPSVTAERLIACKVLHPFPMNPTTSGYPEALRPLSDFCNGLYQYMLLMTETIFKVRADPSIPPEEQAQKLYFNVSMHRSMIWILDKYAQFMRRISLPDGSVFAPTFEFVDLGGMQTGFARLKALGEAAIEAAKAIDKEEGTQYAKSVRALVATAVSQEDDGNSMHLPDVSTYWTEEPAR